MFQALLSLRDPILRDRNPGQQVLQNNANVIFTCLRGWAGRNCDKCDVNFEPPGQCSRCRTGWIGDNCDSWAPNFGPPGECTRCSRGWKEPDCDMCAPDWAGANCDVCDRFGFSAESNCTECIVNGTWEGQTEGIEGIKRLEVKLTFDGESCHGLFPGTEH